MRPAPARSSIFAYGQTVRTTAKRRRSVIKDSRRGSRPADSAGGTTTTCACVTGRICRSCLVPQGGEQVADAALDEGGVPIGHSALEDEAVDAGNELGRASTARGVVVALTLCYSLQPVVAASTLLLVVGKQAYSDTIRYSLTSCKLVYNMLSHPQHVAKMQQH
jgi:hypothetical protein